MKKKKSILCLPLAPSAMALCAGLLTSCGAVRETSTWAGPAIYDGEEDTTLNFLATERTYTSKSGAQKVLNVANLSNCPTSTTRVGGKSRVATETSVLLFFRSGATPSLRSAYEDAIRKAPGAIALKDVTISHVHVEPYPIIFLVLGSHGEYHYELTGTPVYPD